MIYAIASSQQMERLRNPSNREKTNVLIAISDICQCNVHRHRRGYRIDAPAKSYQNPAHTLHEVSDLFVSMRRLGL